jgi:hypothetical protein
MSSILNSNFLQTIVIFLTGCIAFIIYFVNKRAEKKDAAKIIINEIRLAEKAINDIKNKKMIIELSLILPTNTWQYKKHLFLKHLDQDDINLIDDFYYKCIYAEQYRKMLFDIRNNSISVKATYLQQKLIDIMHESINGNNENGADNYENMRKVLIDKANNESWLFTPTTPMASAIQYIESITMITPSNAGRIIKKIAT